MVLCPFHRSHREICTRNRPVSETTFLDDFSGPLSLPAPLFYCWRIAAEVWRCPEYGWTFPEWNPEQIRKHPGNALRANSEFLGFVRLEIPKPWKIKQIPSLDSFQKCASPSTVGTLSFFGRAPSIMEQPELVMRFLTVLGAPLRSVTYRGGMGHWASNSLLSLCTHSLLCLCILSTSFG